VNIIFGIFRMIYLVFLETAPFLLLGLFLAGWLKIMIPTRGVHRYLGHTNLRSAVYASLFGIPLPICSCGVVPLSIGLKEKGASRESNLSFLISTPETSIDTVIITWGLLGPLMAVVRPITAFINSMFAAILSVASRTDRPDDDDHQPPEPEPSETIVCESCHEEHEQDDYHVVGPGGFWRSLTAAFTTLPAFRKDKNGEQTTGEQAEAADAPVPLRVLAADANRYAFREMMDDISIWLVVGIAAAGAIAALLPSNWVENMPGGQLGGILFMLLISIPIYVCAVESTPIAAILLLKGLSPGAALVFLMAGPATNLASLILLHHSFGRRFVRLYLTAIAVASVACGLALNWFLGVTGLEVVSRISAEGGFGFWKLVQILSAIALLVLLTLSFSRLNWTEKWQSMRGVGGRMLLFLGLLAPESIGDSRGRMIFNRRRLVVAVVAIALIVYLLTGLYTVPPGSAAYKLRLGRLVKADIPPGLHVRLPRPFERVEIYRVKEMRKTDLGFRTDMKLLDQWKKNPVQRLDTGWHSFFTTMHNKPEESLYLIGDENQLEAKFAIHYRISNPSAFFFDYAKNEDLVSLAVASVIREHMAVQTIDNVLTEQRNLMPPTIKQEAQMLLDRYGIGVELLQIYIVDLHPPVEVVAKFREVASAMEDRQTRIHKAYGAQAAALPKARGQAAKIEAAAEADALEVIADGSGRAESFTARREAYRRYREATRFRMFLEAMERTLPQTRKFILPPDVARNGRFRLWSGDIGNRAGLLTAGD